MFPGRAERGGRRGGRIDYRSQESRSVTHTPTGTALMDASGEQGALFSAACHSQTSRVTQDGGPPSLGVHGRLSQHGRAMAQCVTTPQQTNGNPTLPQRCHLTRYPGHLASARHQSGLMVYSPGAIVR